MSSIETTVVPVAATWQTMSGGAKAVYLAKVAVMLCTFGFVFPCALVEGMKYEYEELPPA